MYLFLLFSRFCKLLPSESLQLVKINFVGCLVLKGTLIRATPTALLLVLMFLRIASEGIGFGRLIPSQNSNVLMEMFHE
jgi:hypothetical protein